MACRPDTPPRRGQLSSRSRADEIKKDQGFHECEVSLSGEADLHEHFGDCRKHLWHRDFVPVKDFSLEHLPPAFRDNLILILIRIMVYLTVRVCVTHTSHDRVKTYPGTDEPYPFYHHRGSNCLRTGTGMVICVDIYTKRKARKERKTCPCDECKDSPTPMTEWCTIGVHTAHHVAFDDSEAKHTTCQLFYGSDNGKNKIQELQGWAVNSRNDIDFDTCIMICHTHDVELGERLEGMTQLYLKMCVKLRDKLWTSVIEHPLVVIVSHPHGRSKHVTVGKMTHKEVIGTYSYKHDNEDDPTQRELRTLDITQYKYTAPTCPGCSGAPMVILERSGIPCYHTHSQRCEEDGINMSGVFFSKQL